MKHLTPATLLLEVQVLDQQGRPVQGNGEPTSPAISDMTEQRPSERTSRFDVCRH